MLQCGEIKTTMKKKSIIIISITTLVFLAGGITVGLVEANKFFDVTLTLDYCGTIEKLTIGKFYNSCASSDIKVTEHIGFQISAFYCDSSYTKIVNKINKDNNILYAYYLPIGEGTEENPYEISSYDAFKCCNKIKQAYFVMTSDITIDDLHFKDSLENSIFDGNGHKINYKLRKDNNTFIANIDSNSTIKDVKFSLDFDNLEVNFKNEYNSFINTINNGTLSNVSIVSSNTEKSSFNFENKKDNTIFSGLCAQNYGHILNCSSDISFESFSQNEKNYVSGLVGENNNVIAESTANGNIAVNNGKSAMLCAINYGSIVRSTSLGQVFSKADGDGGYAAAGMCIINKENGLIDNCRNETKLYIGCSSSAGILSTGGIVASNIGKISRCLNNGYIYDSSCLIFGAIQNYSTCYYGGIAGLNSGIIKLSKNNGIFTFRTNGWSSYGGGIVGGSSSDNSLISNCYNNGSISGETISSDNYGTFKGGIIGESVYNGTKVIDCFNIGKVKGNSNNDHGGIAGYFSLGTITNCSYYIDCFYGIGYNKSNEGCNFFKSLNDMTLISMNLSFEFWTNNGGMPHLKWES